MMWSERKCGPGNKWLATLDTLHMIALTLGAAQFGVSPHVDFERDSGGTRVSSHRNKRSTSANVFAASLL